MNDQEFPWERDLLSLIYQPTSAEVAATRAPVPFIWEGRIPAGRVSIFSGAGGSGKSSLLVGLVLARACGARFLGKATRGGTTLVISAEDTVIDYMRKIDAWREVYRKIDPVAVARHLKILPLVGEDYRLVSGRYGGTRVEIERVDRLAVAARSLAPRPDLIIVETASRFGAGDENSNESAACLIAACERLASIAEAAVLIVAHVGKTAAREQIVDAYSSRGASAFTDNARSALVLGTISPDRAKRLALTPEEARDLLVLACPKANLAGRSGDIVLERVETAHGLVLRAIDSGGMSDVDAATASAQAARQRRDESGRRLRAVVETLTAAGAAVTTNLLREEHRAATKWIPIRDYQAVIDDAVTDGWLGTVDGPKRGKAIIPGIRTAGSPISPISPIKSDHGLLTSDAQVRSVRSLLEGSDSNDRTRNNTKGLFSPGESDHADQTPDRTPASVNNSPNILAGNSPNIPLAEDAPRGSPDLPWA